MLGDGPEDELGGDPVDQALVPRVRTTQSRQRKIRMITDLRQLNPALVQTPKFKTDNWQTVRECNLLNRHLT